MCFSQSSRIDRLWDSKYRLLTVQTRFHSIDSRLRRTLMSLFDVDWSCKLEESAKQLASKKFHWKVQSKELKSRQNWYNQQCSKLTEKIQLQFSLKIVKSKVLLRMREFNYFESNLCSWTFKKKNHYFEIEFFETELYLLA